MSKFGFIMAADPQYPWTLKDDKEHKMGTSGSWYQTNPTADSYADDADTLAEKQVESINRLVDARVSSDFPIRGLMFNGDIINVNGYKFLKKNTELGHFEKYYEKLKVPFYFGLGNHDYVDNLGKTGKNVGSTAVINYLLRTCLERKIYNVDCEQTSSSVPRRTFFNGSFSYSFDVGHVHFVQLHNYPGYKKIWSGFSIKGLRNYYVCNKNCYDWLAKDLAAAYEAGKAIIVCFHIYKDKSQIDDSRYIDLFNLYKVSAIFVGHNHTSYGKISGYFDIPTFYCGSTSQSNYILLEIEDEKLTAIAYSSLDGECQKINAAQPECVELKRKDNAPEGTPAGFVKFESRGGYTVEFTLRYKSNGHDIEIKTGRLMLLEDAEYDLPAGATDYEVSCMAWNGLSWKDKFDTYKSDTPFNCTFRTYGALPNPKMEVIKD